MLPTTINSTEPTTINSTEPTNDTTSTTTTIDNQINNNLIETLPCLDFWSYGEHIDCQRLFSSTHISNQPFFLHDLQPAIIARYIRITLIGQSNISVSSIRLPVGYFFGYPYILNDDNDNMNTNNNNNNEKYEKKLKSIEGIYETLISNYALCRQKLFNLLSTTNNVEKNFIENIYHECIQLQIQINHAHRQINQCRNLLKMEDIQIHDPQPTSDYLKLLADLLTSELTSLSGMMQQTDRQINQYRNLLQIEHMQINDQQPTNDYLKLLAYLLTSQLTSLSGMMQQTDKINSSNETTIYYNRLLAIEYINNIYNLLLNTNNNYQSIE
ncbi:unnamed protein product [Rotaria sp. Silwood1]|nr:unnamed protein product [Rotaria sp. Silwood1]